MPHTLYQVDAFTDVPFKGNPAAVCMLAAPEPETWMQSLAAEMNLSETAFLLPEGDGWRLRWFTPMVEVDLCGHATLASAKVLFMTYPMARNKPIIFYTRSGKLTAHWVDGAINLNFPAMSPEKLDVPDGIGDVLGFRPIQAAFSGNYFVFEAGEARLIRDAQPDFAALKKLPMPEVIITAKSDNPEFDFISRFFAPQLGIDEDPVTGSAHCLLTPYWAQKTGKVEFIANQASQRGGVLHLRLDGKQVSIMGDALIIFKAGLLI